MYTTPSDNSKFTATFQGDPTPTGGAAYTRSRSMLRLVREDTATMSLFEVYTTIGLFESDHTTYYTTPEGELEISMANAINQVYKALGSGTITIHIRLLDLGSGTELDTLELPVTIYGGISYYDADAPREKCVQAWYQAFSSYYVLPPNVIFNPALLDGIPSPGIIVESNFGQFASSQSLGLSWLQVSSGITSTVTPSGERDNQIEIDSSADTLHLTDGVDTASWKLSKAETCTNMVCIRWTSLTGATRQHFFPIVAFLDGADKSVSLVTPGDGYEVKKDAWKGIRCRLTGLTSYGYWYYADLIRANDVHAIIHPTLANFENEITSKATCAFVEDADVETTIGMGFYNFDFTLKLRHYDTY